MKRLSILASMIALGVVLLLLPSTASASCANAITFNQGGYACPGGLYCYVTSPADPTIAEIQADFWSLTFGDPAVGPGSDDGARANSDWLTRFSPAYGIYMQIGNNWSQPLIDGCIQDQFPAGFTQEIMVAAFSDEDPSGSTSYWAASATTRDPTTTPQFNFKNTPASNIAMVEIPLPQIVASRKIAADTIEVDIQCNVSTAGFYTDGNAQFADVVQGCQIFQQQLALGSPGPDGAGSRDVANWTQIGGVIAPSSVGTVVLSGCNATNDFSNYLAVGVAFDSGFTTTAVSANSNRVDCGPNVANPSPRFKIIDRNPNGKGRLEQKDR